MPNEPPICCLDGMRYEKADDAFHCAHCTFCITRIAYGRLTKEQWREVRDGILGRVK